MMACVFCACAKKEPAAAETKAADDAKTIGILNNGMSMMGISADCRQTVKGLVILGAVALDLVPKRKKK